DFDAALRQVMRPTRDRLDQSLRRFGDERVDGLDPELRRSFVRARARLAAQAERARETDPEVATAPEPDEPALEAAVADGADDDVSLRAFEAEIEETSDLLVVLERIASIEQQQLEHHRSQLLRDVRGVFFAAVVSVAVIVAGVAPLVEATPRDRGLI